MAVILPEIGDTAFIPEVWALYGVGVLVLLLRFAIRIRTIGFKGFQGDDYFSILTLAFYTVDAVTVHNIFYTGTNVEANIVQATQTLTAADIEQFERGSKEQLAAWYSYTALIWSMKATMLFFFNRLTIGLWQHRFVKWIGVVCAVTYLAVVLTITFGCFPTQRNWQVIPDPGLHCTLKLQNFLVTVVLNVVTDALILAIPVPLLWTLRIPLRRKLIISALLCSGLFVIAAAIIRVALTLGSNPSATNINRWGVRETIVGIFTINAPILRPMFRKRFWSSEGWRETSITGDGYAGGTSRGGGGGFDGTGTISTGKNRSGKRCVAIELSSKSGVWSSPSSSKRSKNGVGRTRVRDLESGGGGGGGGKLHRRGSESTLGSLRSNSDRGASTERINQGNNTGVGGVGMEQRGGSGHLPMEVKVETEVRVESESVNGDYDDGAVKFVEEEREEEWVREEREDREKEHKRSGSSGWIGGQR